MKKAKLLLSILILVGYFNPARAQIIHTVAGNGSASFSGDGSAATAASINQPYATCADALGNIYIADCDNGRIRKVSPAGIITTIDSSFANPVDIIIDSSGSLYVADFTFNLVVKIPVSGSVSIIAGGGFGALGDGGPATDASLDGPRGLCMDKYNNLYIADRNNHRIRKVDTAGVITTVAGDGTAGFSGDNISATTSSLNYPKGITIDPIGNLIIADCYNHLIRKVDTNGIISTIAGYYDYWSWYRYSGYNGDNIPAMYATLYYPNDVSYDNFGNLFISDSYNNRVRIVSPSGMINTVAGNGWAWFGGDGFPAIGASINAPNGVSIDNNGSLLISDGANNRIRIVSLCNIDTTTLVPGVNNLCIGGSITFPHMSGTGSWSSSNTSVATVGSNGIAVGVSSGTALISYSMSNSCGTNSILRVLRVEGPITVPPISGATSLGIYSTATLSDALSGGIWSSSNSAIAAIGSSGTVLGLAFGTATISYSFSNACGMFSATHPITLSCGSGSSVNVHTIAGNGISGYSGDGGNAVNAQINLPGGAVVDSIGNLYFVDGGTMVRKIDTSGFISTVAGQYGTWGTSGSGDGGPATNATIYAASSIAFDHSGNLLIAENGGRLIRKVNSTGIISTIAGTNGSYIIGDGGPAIFEQLNAPYSIIADAYGNFYFSDWAANTVKKVDASGVISTIAGNGIAGYSGDGSAATLASLYWPEGIALDATGNLYIVDGFNYRIRKVNTSGIITTIAGTGRIGYSGDGGMATDAQLLYPGGITIDPSGNLLFTDGSNIRKIDATGTISTIAGNGILGFYGDGMPATIALFFNPTFICFDRSGNLIIADNYNSRIRKISSGPTTYVGEIYGTLNTCIGATRNLYDDTYGGTWSSSNTSVATIDSVGMLSGVSAGTSIISYSTPCGYSTKVVNIENSPTSGAITGSLSTGMWSTTSLGETAPGGVWSTSNLSIATVSAGGLVSGVAAGTCIISYGVTNSCGTLYATVPFSVSCGSGSTWNIHTIAGNGVYDFSGMGGMATIAEIGDPQSIIMDRSGNIYFSEDLHHTVLKVNTSGIISLVAGNGTAGYNGDEIPATSAGLNFPVGLAIDNTGNLYIADILNHRVRKVDSNGIIHTVAGNGIAGYTGDGSNATAANLNYPCDVLIDNSGNILIADRDNNVIRKVNSSGVISSVIGNGVFDYSGDGGLASAASIRMPISLCTDPSGNIYIVDYVDNVIRKVNASGIISTVAGTGYSGFGGDGGPATNGYLNEPLGVRTDNLGNLFIADGNNNRIRKVDPSGVISTIAGNGTYGFNADGISPNLSSLALPASVVTDTSGNVYIADLGNYRIRKISAGPTTYVAEISGPRSTCNGTAVGLSDYSYGGTWSSSNPAVASVDTVGNVSGLSAGTTIITYITSCGYSILPFTVKTNPNPGTISGLSSLRVGQSTTLSESATGGSWSISDYSLANINSFGVITCLSTGSLTISYTLSNECGTSIATKPFSILCGGGDSLMIISTIAGGVNDFRDNVPAIYSSLISPRQVATDTSGNIYIVESSTARIRMINSLGIITTIAGNGTNGYSGDGGPATAATFNNPWGVTVDKLGNIYVADSYNQRIRKINSSGIISTIAGNGVWGYNGDNMAATDAQLYYPTDIEVDNSGNLFISDIYNNRIRKVDSTGIITTYAGDGTTGSGIDGVAATSSPLNTPTGITIDSIGNVFIIDDGHGQIRKVSTSGIISTIAGCNCSGTYADNIPATSAYLSYIQGIAVDKDGAVYISESYPSHIRKISTSGIINSIAGTDHDGFNGDSMAAIATEMYNPDGLCFDNSGNLLVADFYNFRIRKIGPGVSSGVSNLYGYPVTCVGSSTMINDGTPGGTYSSSNTAIAVDSLDWYNHYVIGISAGTTTISYTALCGTATITVTVNPIYYAYSSGTVCQGSTLILTDSVSVGTWSSSNISIATVFDSGIVTGMAAGTVIITHTLPCYVKYYTITVNPSTAISGPATLCSGSTISLTNSVSGGTWSSSNTAVATINSLGVATGVNSGTVIISYISPAGCLQTQMETVNPTSNLFLVTPKTSGICSGGSSILAGNIIKLQQSFNAGLGSWSVDNTGSTATNPLAFWHIASDGHTDADGVGVWHSPDNSSFMETNSDLGSSTSITETRLISPSFSLSGLGSATLSFQQHLNTYTALDFNVEVDISIDGGATWSLLQNYFGYNFGSVSSFENSQVDLSSYAGNPSVKVSFYYKSNWGYHWGIDNVLVTAAGVTIAPIWSPTTGLFTDAGLTTAYTGTARDTVYATPSATTIYTATMYSCGLPITDTALVTVNPRPAAIGGRTNICVGTTSTLTEATSGGNWISNDWFIADIFYYSGVLYGYSEGSTIITYALSTGCYQTTTVNVFPSPDYIYGPSEVCVGQTITLYESTTGGAWLSSNPTEASVGSSSGIVTGLAGGFSPTISYLLPNGCSASIVVIVDNLGAISGPTSVCQGHTITLTNATPGGTWSTGSSNISIGASTGVVSGLSAGAGIVSYSLPSGCIATFTVTVNASASISGPNRVCQGQTITLSSDVSGGTWSSSIPTMVAINGSTGVATGIFSSIGSSIISYSLGSGCISTFTVTEYPLSAISGPSSVCQGQSISLSDLPFGGVWSSSTSNISVTSSSGVVTGSVAGTSIVSYTTTNACVATKLISVYPLAPITGTTTVCQGQITALANSVGGGVWTSSSVTIATVGSSSGIVTGVAGGLTANIIYSLSTGCTTSITVTVNPLSPIFGPSSVCQGSTITLSNISSGGTWASSGGSLSIGSASGIVTGVAAGTGILSYIMSSGCIATKVVTVNPIGSISGPGSVCNGQSITLTSSSPGGVWSSSSPSIATIGSSSGMLLGVAGGYSATINYTLGAGCLSSTVVTVNPLAPISGLVSVCTGLTINLTDPVAGGSWSSSATGIATVNSSTGLVTGVAGGTVTISYTLPTGCTAITAITVGAMSPITGPNQVCVTQPITLSDATPGGTWQSSAPTIATVGSTGIVTGMAANLTANITYAISSTCRAIKTVTVRPLTANSISGTIPICVGVSNPTATNSTAGGTWSTSSPAIVTIGAGGLITGVSAGSAIISYSLASGCVAMSTVTVNALSPIVGPSRVCLGKQITLTDATPGGTWTSGGASASIASINSSGVVTGLAANLNAILTYTLGSGCKSNITVSVLANPSAPAAIVGASSVSVSGSTITLTDATSGGTWSSSNTAKATIGVTGIVTGVSVGSTIITYTVSNAAGCTNIATKIIAVGPVTPEDGGTSVARENIKLVDGNIVLVPNPNDGEFILKGTLKTTANVDMAIEVMDIIGQVVYKGKAEIKAGQVNERVVLSNTLANGMYLLNLQLADENYVFHFVVER